MKLFKAKKTVTQSEIDVDCGNPMIILPRPQPVNPEEEPIDYPAAINFGIPDLKPVELINNEWEQLKKLLIKIAKRSPDLKDIVE